MSNTDTLQSLIDATEANIALCDSWLTENSWRFVEHMAATRGRAAATMRAMMRWYGKAPRPMHARRSTHHVTLEDLADANRDLMRAYDDALDLAGPDAPEARLLEEQLAGLMSDRAMLALRQVAAVSAARTLPGEQPATQQAAST